MVLHVSRHSEVIAGENRAAAPSGSTKCRTSPKIVQLCPGLHQAVFVGKHDSLNPISKAQLGQDVRYVGLHCGFADEQHCGNFGIAETSRELFKYLALTDSEQVETLGACNARPRLGELANDLAGDRWVK